MGRHKLGGVANGRGTSSGQQLAPREAGQGLGWSRAGSGAGPWGDEREIFFVNPAKECGEIYLPKKVLRTNDLGNRMCS